MAATSSNTPSDTPTAKQYTPEQDRGMLVHLQYVDQYLAEAAHLSETTADVATATFALVGLGIIPGIGSKAKGAPRPTGLFTLKRYADEISDKGGRQVSESNLIQWRNLGHLISTGVKPGDEVWALAYNSGAKVNSGAVTDVLAGPKPTPAKVKAALAPKVQARGNGNTSGTRKSPAVKAGEDVAGALAILSRALPNLTPSAFTKAGEKMSAVYETAKKARGAKLSKAVDAKSRRTPTGKKRGAVSKVPA